MTGLWYWASTIALRYRLERVVPSRVAWTREVGRRSCPWRLFSLKSRNNEICFSRSSAEYAVSKGMPVYGAFDETGPINNCRNNLCPRIHAGAGRRGHNHEDYSLTHGPSGPVRKTELGIEWFRTLDVEGHAILMILIETTA